MYLVIFFFAHGFCLRFLTLFTRLPKLYWIILHPYYKE